MNNGMTAGTIIAVLLTVLIQMRRGRARHIDADLSMSALPAGRALVLRQAEGLGWDREHLARLELVLEEALACLIDQIEVADTRVESGIAPRRLRIEVRAELGGIELALITGPAGSNFGDRPVDQLSDARMGDMQADGDALIRSTSFRLLSTMADQVTHQQFHALDVLTLLVQPRAPR
jgi:hypothetical protein